MPGISNLNTIQEGTQVGWSISFPPGWPFLSPLVVTARPELDNNNSSPPLVIRDLGVCVAITEYQTPQGLQQGPPEYLAEFTVDSTGGPVAAPAPINYRIIWGPSL